MDNFQNLHQSWLEKINQTQDTFNLDKIRVELFGKQGELTQAMKVLGNLDLETRKQQGLLLNQIRTSLTTNFDEQLKRIQDKELNERLQKEFIDVSLPCRPELQGTFHPLTQMIFEIIDIANSMGFSVVEGPHIEQDYYNFDALNIPTSHPARQDHDTFYMPLDTQGQKRVLRTHTSPVQIRTLLSRTPPLQIIVPGRTFRSDHDQTHTPNFHQVEGLMIGKNVHMGHLRYFVENFFKRIFEISDLPVRFRPHYFPFTEPSAEVDILCTRQKNQLILGQGETWLEVLGCGMVHPKVLENCQIDPEEYQGFAFGMGVERIAMLKYGIPDLRSFYESDLRWLRHYGFSISTGLMKGATR